MQVNVPCEFLDPCYCGGQPTNFWIGYGSRPYDVVCPKCRRQVTNYCDSLGGHRGNIIWLWNKIAHLTPDQVKKLAKRQGPKFTQAPDLTVEGKLIRKRKTMTVLKLIEKLQHIHAKGLPKGHVIEADDERLSVLGPLDDGARAILHEIDLSK